MDRGKWKMCAEGAHFFFTPGGILELGTVCQCWALRAEYVHTGIGAPWLVVVAMDGASSSLFTWIGEVVRNG